MLVDNIDKKMMMVVINFNSGLYVLIKFIGLYVCVIFLRIEKLEIVVFNFIVINVVILYFKYVFVMFVFLDL